VRLQIGEVPILWRSDGREYNADLIVVETAGKHWVVEIKADNAIPSEEVQAKRTAAKRWVQHVNAATVTGTDWGYLLVSQTDIDQCQGSWSALKALGT
jgi:type III restriction enzyme